MDITITPQDNETTIAVSGSLNTNTSPELEEKVGEVMDGCPNVCFDFSSLDYISSTGLRVLMGAHKRAAAAGGAIRVTGACDDVREVFEITGFSTLFSIE